MDSDEECCARKAPTSSLLHRETELRAGSSMRLTDVLLKRKV